MEETKTIQWHLGFYAGLELEFKNDALSFDKAHELTRGSLSIDLLIMKKLKNEKIDNEIGEFFKKHNIVEYKSPEDELDIDVFYKVQAYAGLYKASGEHLDDIPAEEVTVTLIRDSYPRELIKRLKSLGGEIGDRHDGIYEIKGP